jgi:hypothetical protein
MSYDNLNEVLLILDNQQNVINNLNERVISCINTLRKDKIKEQEPKKKIILKVERHSCSGFNYKNEMCACAGTEHVSNTGYWFCWRHIVEAKEYISKLEDPTHPKPKIQLVSESDTESDMDTEDERKEYYQMLERSIKKVPISNELSDFLGLEHKTCVYRNYVTKFISKYVKDNGLIDPCNKQKFIFNDSTTSKLLFKLLGNPTEIVTYFNLQKYLKHHYLI